MAKKCDKLNGKEECLRYIFFISIIELRNPKETTEEKLTISRRPKRSSNCQEGKLKLSQDG